MCSGFLGTGSIATPERACGPPAEFMWGHCPQFPRGLCGRAGTGGPLPRAGDRRLRRRYRAALRAASRKRGRSAPRTPRGTLSMEKEFPESQAGEIPRRPLPTGVPPGTLNIVGMGMQRSPIVVRLRRTPMFGSRRTDVLEFLSGYSRQKSPHCQDAEKKTAVAKVPLPG